MKLPLFLLLAGVAVAGVPPRHDVRLYRGTASTDNFDLGVTLLPNAIVRQRLSDEIAQRYIVVEVAFYPKIASVDVSRADFSLRNKATGQVAYSALPSDGRRQRTRAGRTVSIYPEASIGYETGGYDPMSGRRRGGVYRGAGVGVGVGPAVSSPPPGAGRPITSADLTDLQLQDGAVTQPIAGYLYFPITSHKRDAAYEVVFRGPQGAITLAAGQP